MVKRYLRITTKNGNIILCKFVEKELFNLCQLVKDKLI